MPPKRKDQGNSQGLIAHDRMLADWDGDRKSADYRRKAPLKFHQ